MTQDVKITAKKLRTELKTAFKTCKFSVKVSRYSMGQSIHISWENGVSEADVETLINRVKAEYKAQNVEIRNERSTFIFTHRRVTTENRDAIKTSIIEELILNPVEGLCEWDFERRVNGRVSNTTFF